MSRRSISYTLSHSRIPTKSTLQQLSTVRSMSWQAELFLIVDPSLLQVLISLIIITSSQGSSSRGEWTSYFHFSVISRRTDTLPSMVFSMHKKYIGNFCGNNTTTRAIFVSILAKFKPNFHSTHNIFGPKII